MPSSLLSSLEGWWCTENIFMCEFHATILTNKITTKYITFALVMYATGHHGTGLHAWQRYTGRSQSRVGRLASAKPQTLCTTVPGVTWPILQFGMAYAVTIYFSLEIDGMKALKRRGIFQKFWKLQNLSFNVHPVSLDYMILTVLLPSYWTTMAVSVVEIETYSQQSLKHVLSKARGTVCSSLHLENKNTNFHSMWKCMAEREAGRGD